MYTCICLGGAPRGFLDSGWGGDGVTFLRATERQYVFVHRGTGNLIIFASLKPSTRRSTEDRSGPLPT